MFDVVIRLHQLSLATSSEWYNEINHRALSNLLFEATHQVIVFGHEEVWNSSLPTGVQGQEEMVMYRVWAAGLPLYIWATIRHIRTTLGLLVTGSDHAPLLARIRDSLEAAGGHHSWPRGKRLEPVLVTLVYGIESCDITNSPWRRWAMDTLRRVVEILKLKTEEDFRKVLDFSPSTEEYRVFAERLWAELVYGTSAAGTPMLSFSPI